MIPLFLRSPDRFTLGAYGPPFLSMPFRVQRAMLKTHVHLIGKSGSGKSRFLAHLFLELFTHGFPVTLIDPHGDLATLVLGHLIQQGFFTNRSAFDKLLYLDLAEAERRDRYLSFNPLAQDLPSHTIAAN